MYYNYLIPSIYAHILHGLLLLFAFILLYKNFTKIKALEPYKLIILTLLFSFGVGMHGLSHLGLEQKYKYNPLYISNEKPKHNKGQHHKNQHQDKMKNHMNVDHHNCNKYHKNR